MKCINKDCYYLHEHANQNDIINKNDSQTKFQFLEQQKIATKIADIYALDKKQNYIKKGLDMKKEFEKNKIEVFFPTIDTIYEKKFVQDYENEKRKLIMSIMNIITQKRNSIKIIIVNQTLLVMQVQKKVNQNYFIHLKSKTSNI
jgi:hypothetical protein